MAILKASELDFSDKKIKMIISGFPGIGKTTLALSAPSPLLIDLDDGISRVQARHRKDTLVASSYDELITDLTADNLTPYETIVIDTGGKLLDFLKPVVIRENPQNGQRDGSLTLKGYGAVSKKFNDVIKLINSFDKHVIVVFHTKEEKDGDNTKLRLLIEGQSKDNIWQEMDLGGFIEMQGKNRVIGFKNCERYYAKSCNGIDGSYIIPELADGVENNFLTLLFKKIIDALNAEVESPDKEIYTKAMKLATSIAKCKDADMVNKCLAKFLKMKHALTSYEELKVLITTKANELSLVFDKDKACYVDAPGAN